MSRARALGGLGLRRIALALAGSLGDAWRAALIAPQYFARCRFEATEGGVARLVSRRRHTFRNRVSYKWYFATRIFRRSLALRLAPSVRVPRLGAEGMMANVLHVLEVLHRVDPGATVCVDWTLDGSETGFRFGAIGENVWTALFRPIHAPGPALDVMGVLDLALWGSGKDYQQGAASQRQRQSYHDTFVRWVAIESPRVREQVAEFEQCMRGQFVIGVHRRAPTPMVHNLQRDGRVPDIERFIGAAAAAADAHGTECLVFLATDDAHAVAPFRQAFGTRLLTREGVRRTTGDGVEVHFGDWSQVSRVDAEDVLIDTLLLARCNVLFHASSSVSTVAAILNPEMPAIRVGGDPTTDPPSGRP